MCLILLPYWWQTLLTRLSAPFFLLKGDVSLGPSIALQAANTSVNVKESFCEHWIFHFMDEELEVQRRFSEVLQDNLP